MRDEKVQAAQAEAEAYRLRMQQMAREFPIDDSLYLYPDEQGQRTRVYPLEDYYELMNSGRSSCSVYYKYAYT